MNKIPDPDKNNTRFVSPGWNEVYFHKLCVHTHTPGYFKWRRWDLSFLKKILIIEDPQSQCFLPKFRYKLENNSLSFGMLNSCRTEIMVTLIISYSWSVTSRSEDLSLLSKHLGLFLTGSGAGEEGAVGRSSERTGEPRVLTAT